MNLGTASERIGVPRALLLAVLLNALWINVSEWFRYYVFVMAMMRQAFPQIPDVAPLSIPVALVWEVWGTILIAAVVGFTWLFLERFGGGTGNALAAGTWAWLGIFGILWIGLLNMNLATPSVVAAALPLAWVELAVAALIVDWCRSKYGVHA